MLHHRSFSLLLSVPFLFALTGCWPKEKKEKAPINREIENAAPIPTAHREPTAHQEPAARAHGGVIEIVTDADLDNAFAQGKPVIAKFWAEWCGPCQRMQPIFHDLAQEYAGKITFVELNHKHAEENSLFGKYKIESFPTFIYFDKHGKQVEKREGGYDKEVFKAALNNFANKGRP